VIFCADSSGKRLWKIDFSGNVQKIIRLPAKYSANYGTVDYYHSLWITDKNNHCILKFNNELDLIDVFGSYGKGDNQFIEPRGIAVYRRFGQMFIAEKPGAQYYWTGTDIKSKTLEKNSINKCYTLTTDLKEYSFVSLFSIQGKDTTRLLYKRYARCGINKMSINTKQIEDLKRSNFILRIEPTYSSYTYYHWDYPIELNCD